MPRHRPEMELWKKTVHLSMKNCIKELLIRFNHPNPSEPCHSPHANKALTHGAKIQHASVLDSSPSLDKENTKLAQAIIG